MLSLLLLVAITAGCSGGAESTVVESGADESMATAEGGAAFETAEEGVLTMATNAAFPPYEFYEGEEVVGIDVEIARAIAEKLGLELVVEDMEFDSIIPAIQTGRVDIGLAGMTVTPEREEEVAFTDSYATGVQAIIVPEGSPIETVDDLFEGGYTIGVQRNTTGDLYTTWDLEDEGLATIDRYSRGADAVMALTTGRVDCVVIDNEPAKNFVANSEGLNILETEYLEEQYAAAMRLENEALYEAVNGALQELIADGTTAEIIEKYIPSTGDMDADSMPEESASQVDSMADDSMADDSMTDDSMAEDASAV